MAQSELHFVWVLCKALSQLAGSSSTESSAVYDEKSIRCFTQGIFAWLLLAFTEHDYQKDMKVGESVSRDRKDLGNALIPLLQLWLIEAPTSLFAWIANISVLPCPKERVGILNCALLSGGG